MDRRFLTVLGVSLLFALVVSSIFYQMTSRGSAAPKKVNSNTVDLVVAARPLSVGMSVKPPDVKVIKVADNAFPKGGFSKVEEVIDRPVISNILLEEPILDGRLAARGLVIALVLDDVSGQVGLQVVVDARGVGRQRLLQVGGHRERLKVDVQVAQRVLGQVTALGDHQRHRLADVPDFVFGERHLGARVEDGAGDGRRRDEQRAGLPVVAEVFRRKDGHNPRAPAGARRIDAPEAGVGVGAAEESGVQHPRQLDVVHKQRLAGEEPGIFVAFDRSAEIAGCHAHATARQNAASPPWNFHGKTPRVRRRLCSSGRPISPPRFSTWTQSCGKRALCVS